MNQLRALLLIQAASVPVADPRSTTPDLEVLAPKVPEHTRTRLLQLDKSLDGHVAAWYVTDTTRPRLRLLGPVEVRASGERTTDVDRRLAYYTEVVAYLASRDY